MKNHKLILALIVLFGLISHLASAQLYVETSFKTSRKQWTVERLDQMNLGLIQVLIVDNGLGGYNAFVDNGEFTGRIVDGDTGKLWKLGRNNQSEMSLIKLFERNGFMMVNKQNAQEVTYNIWTGNTTGRRIELMFEQK